MDKKTISLGVVLILLATAGIDMGIESFKHDEYVCGVRLELGSYPCDSFTQYYELPNGKCINSDTGNKICRSGWKKIINESEVIDNVIINYTKNEDEVIFKNRIWSCEGIEPYDVCRREPNHQAYYYQLI